MSTLIHERSQAPMQGTDAFLAYLTDWLAALEPLDLAADWAATGVAAENIAVFVVDMVNGFCHAGPLAGERVKGLIAPVQAAIERCHSLGVRHFLLPQDTHEPNALEFVQFGPHCVAGQDEADTVPELSGLPAAAAFTVLAKNSPPPGIRHRFGAMARTAPGGGVLSRHRRLHRLVCLSNRDVRASCRQCRPA